MHSKNMVDDMYDYYAYAIRRYSLQAFEDMFNFADKTLWNNRTLAKNAISLIRLDHRLEKVNKEEEQAKSQAEELAYKEGPAYKTLQEKLSKAEDEDEYKNDSDPEGYSLYRDMLAGKFDICKIIW